MGKFRLLALFVLWLIQPACTDGRKPIVKVPVSINQELPPKTLVEVADVKWEGNDMTAWTMAAKGNSIYLTGTPFGFARWEVGPNPEVPQLVFTVSNQIDRLFEPWVANWLANGALGISSGFAFMSGETGVSVMSLAETHRPKEVRRYPPYNPNSQEVVADDAYIWSAMVFSPDQSKLFAFRQADFALMFDKRGSALTLREKYSYAEIGETSCCVNAATVFQNTLFVAWRSKFTFYNFGQDGSLSNAREYTGLEATYVTSTSRYLYVLHEPTRSEYPGGIYVFDNKGANVAYLQTPFAPKVFAVNASDSHLYANIDDASVKIYRIDWTR